MSLTPRQNSDAPPSTDARDPFALRAESLASSGHFRPFIRQVLTLTRANLKSRYRKTFAGFLWVVVNPVLMFCVQALVFRVFMKVQIDNYLLFLLSGLLPWIFVTQSLDLCTSLFVTSGPLLKSFPLNPMVLLFAQIADNLVNFSTAFTLLFIGLVLAQPDSFSGIPFVPLAALVLAVGVLSLAWLMATIQVFFRDTRFMVQFGTSVAYFLTPIFYPKSFVPENVRWVVELNPFYRLIEPFRITIYHFDANAFWISLGKGALVAGLIFFSAYFVWQDRKGEIYFHL